MFWPLFGTVQLTETLKTTGYIQLHMTAALKINYSLTAYSI